MSVGLILEILMIYFLVYICVLKNIFCVQNYRKGLIVFYICFQDMVEFCCFFFYKNKFFYDYNFIIVL